ncbi:hypothetical protein PG993_011082 [Apiospora rasikravindrae]|uniref:Uncharacterized protein n=1 Tax=Apiospora rasikravindrae TaxID=990691 RepID=A0ABR1SDJ1_9PEZI
MKAQLLLMGFAAPLSWAVPLVDTADEGISAPDSLVVRPSTEISPVQLRADGDWDRWWLGARFVGIALSTAGAVYNWKGLAESCMSRAQAETDADKASTGYNCVMGAILEGLAIFAGYKNAERIYTDYGAEAKVRFGMMLREGANLAQNVRDYTEWAPNFGIPPYIDIVAAGMANANRLIGRPPQAHLPQRAVRRGQNDNEFVPWTKRAEDHFSLSMGAEVRHIGTWNASHVTADGVVKRSDDAFGRSQNDHEVFALRMPQSGRDYHFAATPFEDGSGQAHLRIGFGPGPMTPQNKRWLLAAKRAVDEDVRTEPMNVDHYFQGGGFDAIVQTHADLSQGDDRPPTGDPEFMKRWAAQWACYFGRPDLGTGELPPSWDSAGMWFSVVDKKAKGTVVSGALAPYAPAPGGRGESLITSMTLEGAIEMDPTCNGPNLDVSEPWITEHDGL